MQASTITLSVGDLIIDHINGILVEIENYSEEGQLRIKCWRVFWVGEKVPASEAYQSWTEVGLINIIEAGSFEHKRSRSMGRRP